MDYFDSQYTSRGWHREGPGWAKYGPGQPVWIGPADDGPTWLVHYRDGSTILTAEFDREREAFRFASIILAGGGRVAI